MTSFHDPDVCHSILDSLPTVMCVVDMHKKIVFWSDGAERITGHLRHAVIGHSCVGETLLHCDQPGCEFCKEDCPIARAIKTSHPAEAGAEITGDRCGLANPRRLRIGRNVRELAMFAIIGIIIVFGCVVAGYLMEHGNLRVLVQPAELIIIGGAAVGTLLVANPLHILKKIAGGIGGVFGSSNFGKQTYIDTLKMMYDLLNKARKDGLMALESDVEEPQKSPVFAKNPAFLKN